MNLSEVTAACKAAGITRPAFRMWYFAEKGEKLARESFKNQHHVDPEYVWQDVNLMWYAGPIPAKGE